MASMSLSSGSAAQYNPPFASAASAAAAAAPPPPAGFVLCNGRLFLEDCRRSKELCYRTADYKFFVDKAVEDFKDVVDSLKQEVVLEQQLLLSDPRKFRLVTAYLPDGAEVTTGSEKELLQIYGTSMYVSHFRNGYDPCRPLMNELSKALRRSKVHVDSRASVEVERICLQVIVL